MPNTLVQRLQRRTAQLLATLMLLLAISACSDSTTPEQGKHYQLLPNDLTALALSPITEVFSLTCGHCRNMEKFLPEIAKATGQKIGQVHVTFNQSARLSAFIYYSAIMQNNDQIDHQHLAELFAAIQDTHGDMQAQKTMIEASFTSRNLVSPYQLNQAQAKQVAAYIQRADTVSRDAEINAVPSFIIKGKYMLLMEAHESVEALAATIDYLIAQP